MSEWPIEPTEAEKPYFHKRFEITTEDGCLLWGIRVIIPKQFRARILEELHTGHPGIVRMKSLARFHVWWPGLDKDIADNVHGCVPRGVTRALFGGGGRPTGRKIRFAIHSQPGAKMQLP